MHLLPLILLPILSLPHLTTAQAIAAGGGAPVALPTVATQDAIVRTVNSLFTIGGVTSASQIVFTQTFAATALGSWELGPTPKPGVIGLGTIQGKIGEVKESAKNSKRGFAVPTSWGW